MAIDTGHAGARRSRARTLPPRLADGVELLGEFEDSGFENPPHLARRSDGQVIQLTELLHLVAEAADGERDEAQMADAVSERFGRRVSADNIRFLVEKKLRPLGVLAAADGSSPRMRKADPLLALKYRTALVPAPAVQRLARVFAWLFSPLVLLPALGGLLAFDVWLLFEHGVAASLRSALYEPVIMLGLFGAVIAATAWHEVGHATACRYGGAKPGVLGAGIYLVWPAFYCDVTDAYRLSRRGRLRTDLGGIYFNGLFTVAVAAAFLVTGFEPLVLVILGQHLIVLQQLIPALRFDGYYVLSDLTGVPDILGRIKPILASLVPRRAPGPRVTELKPWVRRVVATYVVLLVPTLLGLLVVLVMSAPRIFATAYDSFGLQADRIGDAVADGAVALAALGVLQAPHARPAMPGDRSDRVAHRPPGGERALAVGGGERSADGVRGGRHAGRGGLRRVDLVAQRRLRADPPGRARHALGGRGVGDRDPVGPAGVDAGARAGARPGADRARAPRRGARDDRAGRGGRGGGPATRDVHDARRAADDHDHARRRA